MKNPLMRRGMLGAMAAAAAALPSLGRASREPPSQMAVRGFLGAVGSDCTEMSEAQSREHQRRWERYEEALSVKNRAHRRANIMLELLGGYPPGMEANHSWRPWFRAQAAARRMEQAEWDAKSMFDKLRVEFLGR